MDEQIIMETTGHKSTNGVHCYKRTSAQQKESVSDILSLAKQPKQIDLDVHHYWPASQALTSLPIASETHQQDMLKHVYLQQLLRSQY